MDYLLYEKQNDDAGQPLIVSSWRVRVLDGKRYYAAFPDQNPERPDARAVLDALEKLEAQFREQFGNSLFGPNQGKKLNPPRKAER
jgi:hypothetical protein